MGRRSGLGRGLSALIPETPDDEPDAGGGELQELAVTQVRPNRYQPRGTFDEDGLAELASSIEVLGVLQPILVRRVDPETGDGALAPGETAASYELIAGERRWRAAQRAGLTHIPALVREVEHQQSLEQALVENLHRQDLNPVEEAAAYRQLIDDFGLAHDEVATRVGKSRSAVSNTLRLLNLPPAVLELLVEGRLGAGHGRAVLGLDDEAAQVALAQQAADEAWSVRRVEEEVRRRQALAAGEDPNATTSPPPAAAPSRPAALLELEHLLSDHLDTRVNVQLSGQKGRVVVEFGGLEDLERIYRTIVDGRERA